MKWSISELKEMWREENWERKANGIGTVKWSEFKNRSWVKKAHTEGWEEPKK